MNLEDFLGIRYFDGRLGGAQWPDRDHTYTISRFERRGLDTPFGKHSGLLDQRKEVILWNPAFYS